MRGGRRPKNARCDVAMLVDEETVGRNKAGRSVFERNSVEACVLRCLRSQHGRVEVVPFDPAVASTVTALKALNPRLVFNLTEWLDGDRRLDASIAGLLDLLGLRYTGTGPEGLRLARDKALSKSIVAGLGALVPRHFVVGPAGAVRNPGLPYPLVVKPQFGDGSDEVRANSVVRTDREFRIRVRALRGRLREPLICEEFIPGSDLYVALLGNAPEVMPPVGLVIGRNGASAPRMATYRLKNDSAYRRKWRIRWSPVKLEADTAAEVAATSRNIFRALKLRDYARIDFRLMPDNRIVFLEANPNPDLHPHAMGANLCFAGVDYSRVIARIVAEAGQRYRIRV